MQTMAVFGFDKAELTEVAKIVDINHNQHVFGYKYKSQNSHNKLGLSCAQLRFSLGWCILVAKTGYQLMASYVTVSLTFII